MLRPTKTPIVAHALAVAALIATACGSAAPTPTTAPASLPATTAATFLPSPTATPGPAVLAATFIGQDGENHAGRDCDEGLAPDNVHVHLSGLRTEIAPAGFRVEDPAGGGVWENPCKPGRWIVRSQTSASAPGEADLFFKPFRDAPEGTAYTVTVLYPGGQSQTTSVSGPAVRIVLGAKFLGQDGGKAAGQGCSDGDAPDNVHIRLDGLRLDARPISFRVDDPTGRVGWASPCVSPNWSLGVALSPASQWQADLYFKPFRDAPEGTRYTIAVQYEDGLPQTASVIGSHVYPVLAGAFVGQDGRNVAGRNCTEPSASADNVHLRVSGLRQETVPVSYELEDRAGGGRWTSPCQASDWALQVDTTSAPPGQADLYFKPARAAPAGTIYALTVRYGDGIVQSANFIGSSVGLVFGASFLGQDGGSLAGASCTGGATADNVHIRLEGLRTDLAPNGFKVEDRTGGGIWTNPCDPANWWLYSDTRSPTPGQGDLYFKPFRDAPDGTVYTVTVMYPDGAAQSASVTGTRVRP